MSKWRPGETRKRTIQQSYAAWRGLGERQTLHLGSLFGGLGQVWRVCCLVNAPTCPQEARGHKGGLSTLQQGLGHAKGASTGSPSLRDTAQPRCADRCEIAQRIFFDPRRGKWDAANPFLMVSRARVDIFAQPPRSYAHLWGVHTYIYMYEGLLGPSIV